MDEAVIALRWVEAGHRPTLDEAGAVGDDEDRSARRLAMARTSPVSSACFLAVATPNVRLIPAIVVRTIGSWVGVVVARLSVRHPDRRQPPADRAHGELPTCR